jgi:general secretion pathway protein K
VALITALLVVAIAAAMATAMTRQQQLEIQRSANILNAEQAYLYALGAEAFARQVLRRDAEDGRIDHLDEDWASLVPPTVIDGGDLFGRLEDLTGRFNLNNLVDDEGPATVQIAQFQRLLRELELPIDAAWNVVDWLDGDQDPSPAGGAEDLEYLRRTPAYRSAGRLLTSPSELLLIDGFDMAAYQRLEPHVTALPTTTPLNVNTASAILLQGLADLLDPDMAEQLIDARGGDGFASVDAFLDQVGTLAGDELRDQVAETSITIGSNYFLFQGEARFGRGRVQLASLLQRAESGAVTTLRRSRRQL